MMLPLKSSCNKQHTVCFLGQQALPHLPYSPDLAPSDYGLFGPMKKLLGQQKFASVSECNQSFVIGLDSSQHHSLHRAFRSL